MMKKFINQILKEGKSNEFTKDVENSIRYFLKNFSLEEDDLAIVYREYMNIHGMISIDYIANAKYYAFSLINGKINVDDIDDEVSKNWLRFIQKENEINVYLEDNPVIAEKVMRIESLTNEITRCLRDANIKLRWRDRSLNSFEILSIISSDGSYDSEIIKLIKNFKVPSNDFHEVWMANSPSTEYINRSIFRIVDALDNEEAITEDITGSDVEIITDTLLDILVLISEEIILNLKN